MQDADQVVIGKIVAVFGLKGWVKVFSYTQPRENILRYKQVVLAKDKAAKSVVIANSQLHGNNVLVLIEGVADRDQAQLLVGSDMVISREELPPAGENEYYWADLIGLKVENKDGVQFGEVESLFETGANDVLLIKGDKDRAIPFLQGDTVLSIDLVSRNMIVDWDPDF